MKINFEEIGTLPDGRVKLTFTDGDFSGIIFVLGKVSFQEVGEELKLSYEYDVLNDIEYDKNALDLKIGDLIIQMISTGVQNNDLVYKGGT